MSEPFKTITPPSNPGVHTRRWNVSLIWLVPIVAALIGLSMVIHSTLSKGPQIVVSFTTAEGLEANKTVVKYKNVVIGHVTTIALSQDRSHVDATIELEESAAPFTAEDSRFWVVRPRIGASGVSGIETVLSGAFIGADAGHSQTLRERFEGMENPPPVSYGEQGKRYTLHTETLGSLEIGSPVYYRRLQVGQVIAYRMAEDGKGLEVEVFINAPNDKFVTADTRFWNASGVDVSLSANGLKVNTQSLSSIIAGGIAFIELPGSDRTEPAKDNAHYTLFQDVESALAPADGLARNITLDFDQSLRGLEVGAPVELLGVNIGRVTSINLDFDAKRQSFPTRVGAVIYPARMGRANEKLMELAGGPNDIAIARILSGFVKNGLRAQAKSSNLLTGQLYISLGFIKDAPPVAFDANAQPINIPTVPGSLDKLQEQFQDFVDKLSKVPVDQIAGNLNGSLSQLQTTLKLFNNELLPQMHQTLAQVQQTIAMTNDTLAEDSPQRQQLNNAFGEVHRAARSVRVLTDYLGRHPEALIRGRTAEGQPDSFHIPLRSPQVNTQETLP
ncbi:MlaD family protein [Pseudomonas hefeiensis]|uniref:MlaD family protein n=1 Tax=Pseudomonas hefeiensis TaxID=2738125 RepID=A0ABY9GGS8_9PSED|nr:MULTISPECIES: MlaD family protein [unclassified Pseudomonas]WLH14804.1 MlaD family protein [Pseudomonas sp. FP205]WLH97855.1 MlaD family protein [Pseudomonas sp. FP53]WLI42129.1 MlaD family protein [Pseudomonas sp. FP821]